MEKRIDRVILVLQSGGDFDLSDVVILSHHLHKQYNGDGILEVLCSFDKVEREFDLGTVKLIPSLNKTWNKWWCKMNLFSPEMEKYRPFLFMDLDTAVVKDLQGILPPTGNEDKFITLGGFNERKEDYEKYLLSGMMWFAKDNKKIADVWRAWKANTERIKVNFNKGGDQAFIKSVVTNPDVFWNAITDKVANFKPRDGRVERDVTLGWTQAQKILDPLTKEAGIVCFHGQPRIPQAVRRVKWVNEYVNDI